MLAELYSMADYSTTAWRIPIRFAGGCWARRQLRNGIRDVLVASKPRISLTSLDLVLDSRRAELYLMADYSTTTRQIQILFGGGYWARRQLRNGMRDVLVASKSRISPTSRERVLGSMLAELYSMADYSTTARLIQILFPGGCWARRQLRNGIKDVPVASKHRISLTSLEGVLGSMLAQFYSMADYYTTGWLIPIRFAGDCWARHLVSNGIMDVRVSSKPRISLTSLERLLGTLLADFNSIADSSTTA